MRKEYSGKIRPEMDGSEVRIAGWVHEVRDLGKLKFIILRDRDGFLQVTAKKGETGEEVLKTLDTLSKESVVSIKGRVLANAKAPSGFEIKPASVQVVAQSLSPLPLDVTGKVDAELDTRLNNRFMDVRKPEVSAIFKIRAKIQRAFREYFISKEFIEINPPSIIAAASEGGTNLFPITYFEREAFLAQSPQLYKQMMMSTGLDKVFITQPAFRAEPHNTPRHLNEIFQMDIEKAFIKDEEGVIVDLEGVVNHIVKTVVEECPAELEALGRTGEVKVPKLPFKRLTYDECIDILARHDIRLEWGDDIPPDGERALNEELKHQPFIIKHWPTDIRAFYSRPLDDAPEKCGAFDLDYMGMEMSSGAQRIHDHGQLIEALKKRGLNPEGFEFYLKAFRYGMPPHGGWSIGAERITLAICGVQNIRECVLWPRDRHRIEP
ncbi:MAG TPA: aspartate--tRNA(Asn) ligase [Candidatus Altiarchaeales archaeon]|nr:aspartate--tRNA(Asn) ligase [Candidatus Altiarchaeales archaeon]